MGRRACQNCDGSGEVCVHRHGDGYEDEYAPCPDCDAEGEISSALSPESNPEGQR